MGDAEYQDIMRELRVVATPNSERRTPNSTGGWTERQLQTWNRYLRLGGIPVMTARLLLRTATGLNHEGDSGLDQGDFDQAMAELETELEARVNTGRAMPGRGVDLQYWRNRRPAPGKINSRERKMLGDLWDELKTRLPEAARNNNYLLAILRKANGSPWLVGVESLTGRQAKLSIETLKRRLAQEQTKAGVEKLAEVPF